MKVFWVKDGLPEGNISDEDMRKLKKSLLTSNYGGGLVYLLNYETV
jgi:hypothetical protein